MNRRRALGKGLGSILPEMPSPTREEDLRLLNTESIVPNPLQPRQDFGEDALQALAESIRREGVLQPILVRERGGSYELIAGERRWRASLKAGLKRIPAQVREVDDREALELAMVENLQREDLDPIEEARGYQEMAEKFDLKHDAIAKVVGRSRPAVSNAVRLLGLPADLQAQVRSGALTRGHALALLTLDEPSAMRKLAEQFVRESMSVRSAEDAVRGNGRPGSRKQTPALNPNVKSAQDQLQSRLRTHVRIHCTAKGKGRLEIRFSSHEELSRLFDGMITGQY